MNDRVWVFADYKQAEAMVVAWAGPVPLLIKWFREGADIHTNVAQMIAKVVQENRLTLPGGLFLGKHWSEYTRKDPERNEVAKPTVHANNYGMGKRKFALITGLPERYAAMVQEIYFGLFPEIRSGYQAWIDDQLRRNRTLTLPQGWPIQFYDAFGPELSRTAYSLYAQSTVGLLITRALVGVAEHFRAAAPGSLPATVLRTPTYLRGGGLDVRLQIHDALGVSVPSSTETIDYACGVLRRYGEQTIVVRGEPLTIPMDFKVGPNWGDAKDYVPKMEVRDAILLRL